MSESLRAYSVDEYRRLMNLLLDGGWSFASFCDPPALDCRTIYLRHDVDYSLELAAELAELNAELGVRGTFCVQVRAQLYNVFAAEESRRVRRLRELGQHVALHYVGQTQEPGAADDVDRILSDFELLRCVEPDAEPVFSFHRPDPVLLAQPSITPAGLVNAYAPRFFSEMPYLSDSTHRLSVGELEAAVAAVAAPAFQLLLHPINWIAGGRSGIEILIRGWIRVLRDHERTLAENRTYEERFPDGMSSGPLDELERRLLESAAETSC